MTEFAQPTRVAAQMAGFARPWFIAGGWAIDLFLGHQTRDHSDIEIAILRQDQRELRQHLAGWTFRKVIPRQTVEIWPASEWLELPVHEIHAGSPEGKETLEVLLNEADGDEWLFRRNQAVKCPLAQFGQVAQGLPVLSPEIVLLYKAAAPRDKDHLDFANAVVSLGPEQRAWLETALSTCYPDGHPWAGALAAGPPRRVSQ